MTVIQSEAPAPRDEQELIPTGLLRFWDLIDLFQTQRVGAWPKAANDNYHDDHADGDKAERTD